MVPSSCPPELTRISLRKYRDFVPQHGKEIPFPQLFLGSGGKVILHLLLGDVCLRTVFGFHECVRV